MASAIPIRQDFVVDGDGCQDSSEDTDDDNDGTIDTEDAFQQAVRINPTTRLEDFLKVEEELV